MSLKERNEINKFLQEHGCIAYTVNLADGEKIVYFTPEHIKKNIATDSRIKKGIFDHT